MNHREQHKLDPCPLVDLVAKEATQKLHRFAVLCMI